ncbi:hypothetical protein [Williamsia sp.]|uniref:5'-methylthioadenosine/S-adenosylhomocysteine nucleosidase family protein n=1 Tax=Williamsia sp. TaxID=1872085 RepID=UPI0025DED345|nr:hypothetical protein [Williamsia sp.]
MDLDFLKGKVVNLVDDVVISGTSINEASQKLLSAGAVVITDVVAVDVHSWNSDLVKPREPYAALDNRSSMAFCGQIVAAISIVPRPYNIDWPTTTVRLPKSFRPRINSVSGFTAAEVTSSLQAHYDIDSYTFSPQPWIVHKVDDDLGWPASRFCQLQKIRVYVSSLPAGRDISIRIIPLFSFSSLRESEIQDLFEAALASAGTYQGMLTQGFKSATSRLRMIQFIVSAKFGQLWVERLQKSVVPEVRWDIHKDQADYIFTPDVSPLVCALAGQSGLFEGVRVFNSKKPVPPQMHKQTLKVSNTLYLQQQLTRPFTELYRNKEERARSIVKAHGKSAIDDKQYRALVNRLKVGYSIDQLVDLLRRGHGSNLAVGDAREFVSLWLDIALDAGVAVPITAQVNGSIVRAFRHGEDVHFGEAEEHLCWETLSAVLRESENDVLPRVVTEKILVILLRYGVAKSFLHRWDDHRLGAPDTVGVRFSLHGAVVRSGARDLFGEEQGRSLTSRLYAAGRLKRGPTARNRKAAWLLGDARSTDHLPLSANQIREAKKLGLVLGRRLRRGGQGDLDAVGMLTLLATCGPLADLPAALAAEVKLVLLDAPALLSRAESFHGEPYACLIALGKMNAATAAKSGWWKFRHGQGQGRDELLKALKAIGDDEIADELWLDVVEVITNSHSGTVDSAVDTLTKRLGHWLIVADIALRGLRLVYAARARQLGQGGVTSMKVSQLCERARELAERANATLKNPDQIVFVTSVERVSNSELTTDTIQQLHSSSIAMLARLRLSGPSIIEETQARSRGHGGLRKLVVFNSAIRIETPSTDPFPDSDLIESIHNAVDKYRRVSRSGVVLNILPSSAESRGWTIACSSREASRHLSRISTSILEDCLPGLGLRIAILPALPRDEMLYHGEGSTEFYGDGFYKRINAISSILSGYLSRDPILVALDPQNHDRAADVLRLCLESNSPVTRGAALHVEPSIHAPKTLPVNTWAAAYLQSLGSKDVKAETMPVDLGIITVISTEARAVAEVLRRQPSFGQVRSGSKRSYTVGELVYDQRSVTVASTRCAKRTQAAASIAYSDLVREYNPKVIVLLGIAGSIHAGVDLGDVVIANQVIEYDNRKELDAGVKRRGDSVSVPVEISRVLSDFFEDKGEPAHISRPSGVFRLHEGPIGTGSAVVGSKLSDIPAWLQGYNDKTMAVETEAGGVTASFYERAREDGVVGFLIIRGISDKADEEKDDKWHEIASVNATEALRELIPYILSMLDS